MSISNNTLPGTIVSFYTGTLIGPWEDVVEYASLLAGRQLTEEDMRNRKLITGLRDDCMRRGDYRRALGEIFYPR